MSKHTPGPWRVSKQRPHMVERDIEPGVATVATCHDPSRASADAHLIAAAPDLLEACAQFIDIESINGGMTGKKTICGYCGDSWPHTLNMRCPYHMAKVALAKAEGGAA